LTTLIRVDYNRSCIETQSQLGLIVIGRECLHLCRGGSCDEEGRDATQ